MIDNSTITRLMTQAGITITADKFALERFARACFQAGQQHEAERISQIRERFDDESA